jgi:hypothetical protein
VFHEIQLREHTGPKLVSKENLSLATAEVKSNICSEQQSNAKNGTSTRNTSMQTKNQGKINSTPSNFPRIPSQRYQHMMNKTNSS